MLLSEYHSSLVKGGFIYGVHDSSLTIRTLARGSAARIDRIAKKAAVPPPIIRNGTSAGTPVYFFSQEYTHFCAPPP